MNERKVKRGASGCKQINCGHLWVMVEQGGVRTVAEAKPMRCITSSGHCLHTPVLQKLLSLLANFSITRQI